MDTFFNNKVTQLSFILFFVILSTSCGNSNSSTADSIKNATPVTITQVSVGPLAQCMELNAISVFQKKSVVRSVTTGIISSVEINPGDKVSKGQLLFTVITKEAAALRGGNLQEDSILNFNGELGIAAAQSGIVSSVAHQKGDYVQEGDELASLAEQSSLVFNLQVPFELAGFIRTGQTCEIVLTNNKHINGIVSSILPAMDVQAQTLTLIVKPSASENLPENLIALVKIVKYSKKNAYTLSKEAVLTDETQTGFWIMKLLNDSTAVRINIKKGIESNGRVEILEPFFSAADRIVLTGSYELEDTAKVTIITK